MRRGHKIYQYAHPPPKVQTLVSFAHRVPLLDLANNYGGQGACIVHMLYCWLLHLSFHPRRDCTLHTRLLSAFSSKLVAGNNNFNLLFVPTKPLCFKKWTNYVKRGLAVMRDVRCDDYKFIDYGLQLQQANFQCIHFPTSEEKDVKESFGLG